MKTTLNSWTPKSAFFGNIAAAARKARQHLAALRLLAKLEGVHHA